MLADIRRDNILNRRCGICDGFCETMYDWNRPTSELPFYLCYFDFIESFDNEMRDDLALNLKRLKIGGMEFDVLPDEDWF